MIAVTTRQLDLAFSNMDVFLVIVFTISLLIFFILALHFALIVKIFFVRFVNIESVHK